ncbi:MAG: hypothetical protein WB760_23840 [Xanthobacteraceae bacterium]
MATLSALLSTLTGPVLAALLLAGFALAALLLLAGLRLPAAALLLIALWVALALLLVVFGVVLPWIVGHWTFSSRFEGFGSGPPGPLCQCGAPLLVPAASGCISVNCLRNKENHPLIAPKLRAARPQ